MMRSMADSHREARPLLGALSIIGACALFGTNSLFVKLISARVDPWRISFVRFSAGAILAAAVIAATALKERTGLAEGFRIKQPLTMIIRAILGVAQMTIFFIGGSMTSSGRATLLNCTHPIFAAILGFLAFRERPRAAVFAGIGLGFLGAFLVIWDGSAYPLLGNLLCIVSGASLGSSMHFIKRARRDHSAALVYLAPCVLGILITSFAAPGLARISSADWAFVACIAAFAFAGQYLMGWGLKYIAATTGSLLGLSEVLFAVSMSAIFLQEAMPPRFFLGGALVLAGLVLTILSIGAGRRSVAGTPPVESGKG